MIRVAERLTEDGSPYRLTSRPLVGRIVLDEPGLSGQIGRDTLGGSARSEPGWNAFRYPRQGRAELGANRQ